MIFGHGIDLQEISAVKKAYDRNPRFAKKVLTPKEWERFESLSGSRQMSYLAGRWAGKEAFSISLKPTAPIPVPQAFEKASLPAQRPAK